MTFDLSQYDYDLPKELIAVDPIEPRDSSRLLVYDTAKDKVSFDVFRNLEKYLQEQSLIVFNNTKVLPARTLLYKATGGKVEVLFLINEPMENGSIKAMVDRKIKIGGKLSFESGESFKVINQEGKIFFLKPEFEIKHLNELLEKFGQTPIPKYLKEATLKESKLRNRYQSVFAKNPASVAAPTASLHFTDEVITKLSKKGINQAFLTLHVGLGTFAPLTEENLKDNQLHEEFFHMEESEWKKVVQAQKERRSIVAVGSTVTRVLESIYKNHPQDSLSGSTKIFIKPPFEFGVVSTLITNFHLPNSSLMCLVEAFLQHKKSKLNIKQLYKLAIKKKYRFYSFGDAMLIL